VQAALKTGGAEVLVSDGVAGDGDAEYRPAAVGPELEAGSHDRRQERVEDSGAVPDAD